MFSFSLANDYGLGNQFAEIVHHGFDVKTSFRGSWSKTDIESYEQNRYDIRVYDKLREAELQATSTMKHRSHEDVMARAKALLDEAEELKRTWNGLSLFPVSIWGVPPKGETRNWSFSSPFWGGIVTGIGMPIRGVKCLFAPPFYTGKLGTILWHEFWLFSKYYS